MASAKQIHYILDELVFNKSKEARPALDLHIENQVIRLNNHSSCYEEADFDFFTAELTLADIETLERLSQQIRLDEHKSSLAALLSEELDNLCLLKSIYYFSNERYLTKCTFDRHGRPILNSIDKRIVKLLDLPITDILIRLLQERLNLQAIQKPIQVNFTCDFDILNIFTTLGFIGSMKRFAKAILKLRLKQLYIETMALMTGNKNHESNPFLNDKMFHYDGNGRRGIVKNFGFLLVDHQHPLFDTRNKLTPAVIFFFRSLINKKVNLGLHPSYLTMDRPESLSKQLKEFKNYTGENTPIARFHFLRCLYPRELRHLENHGFSEDFSFGFADSLAFRGGITGPFRFWDLDKDCVNPILITPLTLMESTFFDYLHLPLEEAKNQAVQKLALNIRYGNAITLLWHNRSMYTHGFENNYYPELFAHVKRFLKQEELIA